jgi:hypothetical protein
MSKLTFYPLGNADCCRMDLANGKKLLFDYADTRCKDNKDDKRTDLLVELRKDLNAARRTNYEVVAFSHLDKDHICGSSEFFYLEHDKKYQSGDRIRIDEMWVPAAVIIEDKETLGEEHAVIQKEARHRLRNKKGIRVFSRPELLRGWLEKQSVTLDEVRHLITDAGQTVPGFTREEDGVEFFAHSPFAKRLDECEVVDRNCDSLVLQVIFDDYGTETKVIMGADTRYDVIEDMVDVTRWHGREERLEWDVFKLPHHCSYTALGPDKGKDKTEPTPNVKWLFEDQGREGAIIISTSDPIPAEDTEQPPHRQAAKYHEDNVVGKAGEFLVTMQFPSTSKPEPLVIEISGLGAKVVKRTAGGAASVTAGPAPRAGSDDDE